MLKKNKGITLIALVITIIVLIILAGISINLLFGDNGIIQKAKLAGTESEKASDLERIKLAIMEATINESTTGSSDLETALRNNLDGSKLQSVNTNGTVAKVNYNGNEYTVDLQSGTASQNTVDKWDGTTKSTGLVGEGTDASPYLISSASDLMYFADIISDDADITGLNEDKTVNNCNVHGSFASYKITNDISLENNRIYTIGGIPDSNGNDNGRSFFGVFDGDNHEISNIKIESTQYKASFFGYTYGAIIKNLILTNVDFKGEGGCAGIVANIGNDNFRNYRPTTIQNCSVSGKIEAISDGDWSNGWNVGGIVGFCYGTARIENCTVNAEMKGSTFVGGLIGHIGNYSDNNQDTEDYGVKISNCTVNGIVEGKSEVGGIAGEIAGANIVNCVSNVEIKSNNAFDNTLYVGGLVGYVRENLKMENTYSTGSITMNKPVEYLGSLVGFSLTGKLVNCYNTGNMTCTNTVNKLGGLIGETRSHQGGKIICTNCYNSGNIVYDTSKVGTEVGKLIGSIYNDGETLSYEFTGCSNTGSFPISQDYGVIH